MKLLTKTQPINRIVAWFFFFCSIVLGWYATANPPVLTVSDQTVTWKVYTITWTMNETWTVHLKTLTNGYGSTLTNRTITMNQPGERSYNRTSMSVWENTIEAYGEDELWNTWAIVTWTVMVNPAPVYSSWRPQRVWSGNSDIADAVAVDSEGNVYVAMTTQYSQDLGWLFSWNGWLSNDVVLVKYSSGWVALDYSLFATSSTEYITDIVVDGDDALYVVWYYQNNWSTFGGLSLPVSQWSSDLFVGKFSTWLDAVLLTWFGWWSSDYGRKIAVSPNGEYIAVGAEYYSNNRLIWWNTLAYSWNNDNAIILMNSWGTVLSATWFGWSSLEHIRGVDVSNQGDVVVQGEFRSTSLFGMTNAWWDDVYITHFDSGMNLLRSTGVQTPGSDKGWEIAYDSNGDIVAVWRVGSSSATIWGVTLPNQNNNMYVAKFTHDGTVLRATWWSASNAYLSRAYAQSLVIDHEDTIYVWWYVFYGDDEWIFGSETLSRTIADGYDWFVAKLSSGWTVLALTGTNNHVDGQYTSQVHMRWLAVDLFGNIYAAWYYNSPKIEIGSRTLLNNGSNDAFVAQFAGFAPVYTAWWSNTSAPMLTVSDQTVTWKVYTITWTMNETWTVHLKTLTNGYGSTLTNRTITMNQPGERSYNRTNISVWENTIEAYGEDELWNTWAIVTWTVMVNPAPVYSSWRPQRVWSGYYDRADAVAVDSEGNVYVAMTTYYNQDLGWLFSWNGWSSSRDVVLVKYSSWWVALDYELFATNSSEYITDIVMDGDDALYVVWYYYHNWSTFGGLSLPVSQWSSDLFVGKFSTWLDAVLLTWFGWWSSDYGRKIAVSPNGEYIAVGAEYYSNNRLIWWNTLAYSWNNDNAIILMNSWGTVLSATWFGWSSLEHIRGVDVSNQGDVVVQGEFRSTSLFGMTNAWWDDIYITQFDSGMNLLRSTGVQTTSSDFPWEIAYDSKGDIIAVWHVWQPNATIGSVTLPNQDDNVYVAKFSHDGDLLRATWWSASNNANVNAYAQSVVIDHEDTIYVWWYMYWGDDEWIFGSETLSRTVTLGYDWFVAKLSSGWVVLALTGTNNHTDGSIYLPWLAVDLFGNIYAAWYYNSPKIEIGSRTLLNNGSYDAFVAQFAGFAPVYTAPTPQNVPAAFSFTDETDAETGAQFTSNSITVIGFMGSLIASVDQGYMKINNGAFLPAGTEVAVPAGTVITLQHTSSSSVATRVESTLTVGERTDTWSIETRDAITTVNPFTIPAANDIDLEAYAYAWPISIGGWFELARNVTTLNGLEFATSANGPWMSNGVFNPGDMLYVRLLTDDAFDDSSLGTITIGTESADFAVTTRSVMAPTITSHTNNQQLYDVDALFTWTAYSGNTIEMRHDWQLLATTIVSSSNMWSIPYTFSNFGIYTLTINSIDEPTGMSEWSTQVTLDIVKNTPDPFSFGAVDEVDPSTLITSAPITLAGFLGEVLASVDTGWFAINDSNEFVTSALVSSGDDIRFRLMSTGFDATATGKLTASLTSGFFSVTTRSPITIEPKALFGGGVWWIIADVWISTINTIWDNERDEFLAGLGGTTFEPWVSEVDVPFTGKDGAFLSYTWRVNWGQYSPQWMQTGFIPAGTQYFKIGQMSSSGFDTTVTGFIEIGGVQTGYMSVTTVELPDDQINEARLPSVFFPENWQTIWDTTPGFRLNVPHPTTSELYIDGSFYAAWLSEESDIYRDGYHVVSWDPLEMGTYTAYVVTVDGLGQRFTGETMTFTIDTAAPVVTITNPGTVTGARGVMTWTVSTDDTTITVSILIESFDIIKNGNSYGFVRENYMEYDSWTTVDVFNNGEWSFALPDDMPTDKNYRYTITVEWSNALFDSPVVSSSFYYHNNSTVQIQWLSTNPTIFTTDTFSVTYATNVFWYNQALNNTCATLNPRLETDGLNYTWEFENIPNGSYNCTVRIEDEFGVGIYYDFGFTVDVDNVPDITVSQQISSDRITLLTWTIDLTWLTLNLFVDGQSTGMVVGSGVWTWTLPAPVTTTGRHNVTGHAVGPGGTGYLVWLNDILIDPNSEYDDDYLPDVTTDWFTLTWGQTGLNDSGNPFVSMPQTYRLNIYDNATLFGYAVIPAWTIVESAIGDIELPDLTLTGNSQGDGFSFGYADENVSLQFSRPVQLNFVVDEPWTLTSASVLVRHLGDRFFSIDGLTNDPDAQCINGVAFPESGDAIINWNTATIYTCAASEFVVVSDEWSSSWWGSSSSASTVRRSWWGWSRISRDYCPGGDYSRSYYDDDCGDPTDPDVIPYDDDDRDPFDLIDDIVNIDGSNDSRTLARVDELIDDYNWLNDGCYYNDANYSLIAFRDVATHKNHDAIETLLDSCIIQWYNDGNFDPYRTVTRAEFIKIAMKVLYMGNRPAHDKTIEAHTIYSDVDPKSRFAPYVYQMQIAWLGGVFTDTDVDGQKYFGPDKEITYNQAIQFLSMVAVQAEKKLSSTIVAQAYLDRKVDRGTAAERIVSVFDIDGNTMFGSAGTPRKNVSFLQEIQFRLTTINEKYHEEYIEELDQRISRMSDTELMREYGLNRTQVRADIIWLLDGGEKPFEQDSYREEPDYDEYVPVSSSNDDDDRFYDDDDDNDELLDIESFLDELFK